MNDELFKLGFSISYSEVTRYKQASLTTQMPDDQIKLVSSEISVDWITTSKSISGHVQMAPSNLITNIIGSCVIKLEILEHKYDEINL